MTIDTDKIAAFLRVGSDMATFARENRADLTAALDAGLDDFYARASQMPEVAKYFDAGRSMAKAKERQLQHWGNLLNFDFDPAYSTGARRIGEAHAQIGLDPATYLAGYCVVMQGTIQKLFEQAKPKTRRDAFDPEAMQQQIATLMTAAVIDMGVVIGVYLDKIEQDRLAVRAEQNRAAQDQATALASLHQVMSALGHKDLTARMPDNLPGEFGSIAQETNCALGQLSDALAAFAQTSNHLAGKMGGLREASSDLLGRTENQAASLEESNAALRDLTQHLRETETKLTEAVEVSKATAHETENSGQIMQDAEGAMAEIAKSSDQIVAIVSSIDDIAFQTNLLALNASVEAARAGDAGRGFMVVAEEVRGLSQRCAEAAKEIKTLVDASAIKVQTGVEHVTNAGQAIGRIQGAIRDSDGLIADIAGNVSEQSVSLNEISAAVSQIDEITQHNAMMAERTNKDTTLIGDDVSAISHALAQFRLALTDAEQTRRGLADQRMAG